MKLTKKNEWEYETYHDESGKRVEFREGQMVNVQFPDASQDLRRVVVGERRASYSDHGHVSHVTSPTYGVEVHCKGIRFVVDLADIKDVAW